MASANVRLPAALRDLLTEVRTVAATLPATVYLVGGALRDLLLGRSVLDIDLAVDGDAIALAEALAERLGLRVRSHRAFGTATLHIGDLRIDLARLRRETYARPGALPKVGPGSLHDDLARRDFTVNAMAWPLASRRRMLASGDIVDPFGGQADLQQRLIRVLHPRSFSDDATRLWRAVRYEQRLGFALEAETERLLRRDVGYLDAISGDRLRREMELVFAEPDPAAVLHRAAALGVLAQLHPALRLDDAVYDRLAAAQEAPAPAVIHWCLLTFSLLEDEALGGGGLADRLKLSPAVRRAIVDAFALRRRLPELAAPELRRSHVYAMLDPLDIAAIDAVLLAERPTADSRALEWLRWYRRRAPVRPLLSGDDLVRLGVPSGPAVGRLLRALRDAQLDGAVRSRRGAEAWLRAVVVGSDNRVAISTE